jgi:predicted glutamine amidotransferase
MCGLVAVKTAAKNGLLSWDRDEIKQLLIVNSIRGSHSTGLAGVNTVKGSEVCIVKSTGSPYNLFSYADTDKFLGRMVTEFDTVMGHGRYATRGEINAVNAHPFQEGHITLAHNGVINNFYSLKDFQKHKGIEVDSHLIAKLIEEEGVENVLPQVEGAFVFMWHDANDNTFNIARNAQRPLWIAKQKNRETITMASEALNLQLIASRNNTALEQLVEFPHNVIWTFPAGEVVPEERAFKSYVPKAYSYAGKDYTRQDAIFTLPPVTTIKPNGGTRSSTTTTALTELDEILLDNVQGAGQVVVGESIKFVIDYSHHSTTQEVAIVGFNENFPDMIFRTVVPMPMDEKILLSVDYVQGVITSIMAVTMGEQTNRNANFMVFMKDPKFGFDNEEEDEDLLAEQGTVPLIDMMSGAIEQVTITNYKEIAKRGCGWCPSPLSKRALKDPTKLLLYDAIYCLS